mmetsp:Transcript_44442/g.129236  ORF Transcript_44442/g.129236 Transcript_44442/m.129236 type:complete len:216 (+) Transcript_44442:487-1134(+)
MPRCPTKAAAEASCSSDRRLTRSAMWPAAPVKSNCAAMREVAPSSASRRPMREQISVAYMRTALMPLSCWRATRPKVRPKGPRNSRSLRRLLPTEAWSEVPATAISASAVSSDSSSIRPSLPVRSRLRANLAARSWPFDASHRGDSGMHTIHKRRTDKSTPSRDKLRQSQNMCPSYSSTKTKEPKTLAKSAPKTMESWSSEASGRFKWGGTTSRM